MMHEFSDESNFFCFGILLRTQWYLIFVVAIKNSENIQILIQDLAMKIFGFFAFMNCFQLKCEAYINTMLFKQSNIIILIKNDIVMAINHSLSKKTFKGIFFHLVLP